MSASGAPAPAAPPDDDAPMIRADGLTRHYGRFAAVRDVSFSVPRGCVCAFLGPNGAGKSTTMKMLTGFIAPTSGTAELAGFDVRTRRREAARRLGYLPENGPLWPDLTPRGLLRFLADARGMDRTRRRERVDAVIEACRLEAVVERPIAKLSKGYRQRVGMAQALLHEPQVLVLDEPTAGLDPDQIRQVRRLVLDLARDRTILLSTHVLQEVEELADRVVFVHEGRLRFDGTLDAFRAGATSLDDRFAELTGARTAGEAIA